MPQLKLFAVHAIVKLIHVCNNTKQVRGIAQQ